MLELEVREDEKPGTSIYVARAQDADTGKNGLIVYQLQNSPLGLFSIDETSGEITLNQVLDYETRKEYQLTVTATDRGFPPQFTSMNFTVKVKDVNDNPPVFDREIYDFYVPENVKIGEVIDQVHATDRDSDYNSRISYSFVDNKYTSLFSISLSEGKIWTRDYLDRETHDTYEMTVRAVDHGTPRPMSATTLIRVFVQDVNDNAPTFDRDAYRFSIFENLPAESSVGKVIAYDPDMGRNSKLQFFFSGSQSNFTIDSENGEIRTKIPLDREHMSEHYLTVFVQDSAELPKTARTEVKIIVKDDNDNKPVFQRVGPYQQSVSENRPKGTLVMQLVAHDPDQGDNGLVTYTFDESKICFMFLILSLVSR